MSWKNLTKSERSKSFTKLIDLADSVLFENENYKNDYTISNENIGNFWPRQQPLTKI